jgi:hypothetical protein
MIKDNNKSFFSGLSENPQSVTRGSEQINHQIQQLKTNFASTQAKTKTQLTKFKGLVEFNKQLTESYVLNLNVMIQVSQLLREILAFLTLVKQSLDVMDSELSTQLDMSYLQKMTEENINSLYVNFNNEIEHVKGVLKQYDRHDDVHKLEHAQDMMKKTITNASTYVNTIQQTGGHSKRAGRARTPRVNNI